MEILAGVEEVTDQSTQYIINNHFVNSNHSHNGKQQSMTIIVPTSNKNGGNTLTPNHAKENCSEDGKAKKLTGPPSETELSPEEEERLRILLPFHLAPQWLQFNPYIRTGYRGYLNTKLCIESIFWWTNETINIWSHILGCILFFSLTFYDLVLLNIHAPFSDRLLVCLLLVCFQVCMVLSSIYHTFSCRSEEDYWYFLSYDLLGVALSLLAIYLSGVYYAFWCHRPFQTFYLVTVLSIFIIAMVLQLPRFKVDENIKLAVFVGWAAYGVLPTLHWSVIMGGMENPMVNLLLPRVLGMYLISGAAFLIYFSKVPERFCPGWVDYVGSSHQWWHVLVVLALYYWHNTGVCTSSTE